MIKRAIGIGDQASALSSVPGVGERCSHPTRRRGIIFEEEAKVLRLIRPRRSQIDVGGRHTFRSGVEPSEAGSMALDFMNSWTGICP
jgi:hypothetical protein